MRLVVSSDGFSILPKASEIFRGNFKSLSVAFRF